MIADKKSMFANIIGNERVKGTIRRLVVGGRIPHSLLFAGDPGIGKKQFALDLARSLVCRIPKGGEPCGICPSCERVGKFTFPKPDADIDEFKKVIYSEHPDVAMVVSRNRNILVDAVRDLEREANFLPYEAGARVFIVDDAEKMNDAASNALLKTLEEPPPTAYIFLITSRPDSLLATIRSRCQMIRFAPVAADEIAGLLIKEKGLSLVDASLAARLSRGGVGRAMTMDLKRLKAQREMMQGVLRAILADGDRRALLRIGEKMNDAANKDNYEENLDILETLIRDTWLLRLGKDAAMLVNADLAGDLGGLAESASAVRLTDWLRDIETMREGLIVNINRKIATDALFMQMAN